MHPRCPILFSLMITMVLGIGFANAAHVFGTVFDENIQPAHPAAIQINTTPQQQLISLNGTYSFNIPAGSYTLLAVGQNTSAEKNVTILSDGEFRIDLILLPGVPAEDSALTDLLSAPEVRPPEPLSSNGFNAFWLILPILALAVLFGIYVNRHLLQRTAGKSEYRQKSKTWTPKTSAVSTAVPNRVLTLDQQKVMQVLGSFNNRASQKDLRKALDHWSEAKVSMELTELEELGVIQKIKKGRGNIIRKNT